MVRLFWPTLYKSVYAVDLIEMGLSCTIWLWHITLIFTALHGMQARYSDGISVCLSVRPSVCPSVKRVHCDKTEESYV